MTVLTLLYTPYCSCFRAILGKVPRKIPVYVIGSLLSYLKKWRVREYADQIQWVRVMTPTTVIYLYQYTGRHEWFPCDYVLTLLTIQRIFQLQFSHKRAVWRWLLVNLAKQRGIKNQGYVLRRAQCCCVFFSFHFDSSARKRSLSLTHISVYFYPVRDNFAI